VHEVQQVAPCFLLSNSTGCAIWVPRVQVMSTLVDEYLSWMEFNNGRSVATCDKYGRYLNQLAAALKVKGKTLRMANLEDLLQFAGIDAFERKMAASTRRTMVAAIRGFYEWLYKRREISTNPAAAMPYPKAGKKLPIAMSLSALEQILRQPDLETFIGVRDLTIMMIMAGCGPRVSGVVGLNQSDLISYSDQAGQHLVIRFREKGKKERLVPAPHETRLILHAYLNHPELDGIDRSLPNGDQVLFVSTRNRLTAAHEYHGEARRLSQRSAQDRIQHYGEAAGIPKDQMHPHALRHLFGAELAEEDVGIDLRQVLLGHEDPKTSVIYSHIAHRKLRAIIDAANPLGKINTPTTALLEALK